MPLPKPKAGEKKDDFMGRCMANPTAMADFPKQDQRLAVCFSQWEDRNKAVGDEDVVHAWSVLEVKAVSDTATERTIEGVATTPEPDRTGDVVEPMGAQFKLPMPLLFQHDASQPIGTVVSVEKTAKKITFRATMPVITEPGRLKDRLDEVWQTIKAGLVRGVSIGFKPLERSFLDDQGGIRYTSWNWLETSLVTLPANSGATITRIKSIDSEVLAASGREHRLSSLPGASGKSRVKTVPKEAQAKMAKTVAEQISAFEASRVAKAARMDEIMGASAEAGETLNAADSEEYDGLAEELKSIDTHLGRLEVMKKNQALKPAAGADPDAASGSRDPATPAAGARSSVSVKEVKLPAGIEFARYVKCLAAARGNVAQALEISKNWYPDATRIQSVLKASAMNGGLSEDVIRKAAVPGGTTTDTLWASALVDYQQFAGDFIEFLRPQTIIGRFGTNGIPALRRVPFNIQIPAQLSGGSAYWVGEGQPKPLTKFNFGRVELRWAKVANIAVLTDELVRFSNPSADALVRDALAGAIIERLDIDFIDPAKAAVANVSPASITNGATTLAASGVDFAAVTQDVQALLQNAITAQIPVSSGVWIMNSRIALGLSLMLNALGQRSFPDITMAGGTFLGFPVITSDYAMDVVFVIAQEIYLADDGQVTVDASREASLEMLDNPTNKSSVPTPTTSVSMFQTNSIALRAERYINWQRRRADAVAYLTNVDWGGSGLSGT